MATANLGRVGFVGKGTYSGATSYKVNDVVTYNTGTYACIQANTGQAPTNTSYWQNWVSDNAVHKTGDETIAGVKTFSNNTKLNSDVLINVSTQKGRVHIGDSGYQWTSYNLGINLVIDGARHNAIAFLDASSSKPAAIYNNAGSLMFATNMPPLTDKTSDPTAHLRIDTSGNVLVTGSGGLGYGTGSGGTVTQLTSKSTSVTLNKPSGRITMNNAALAGGAEVSFKLYNSTISITDTVHVMVNSASNGWTYSVRSVGSLSGDISIYIKNEHYGSLSDSIDIYFAVIKGAIA